MLEKSRGVHGSHRSEPKPAQRAFSLSTVTSAACLQDAGNAFLKWRTISRREQFVTKEFDEVKGRVLALSLTLDAVISALPRSSAAHAAVGLQIHREALQVPDGVSPEEAHSRDATLDEYIKKLSAAAKSSPN
jgi:hypothetical protein